jgi:lysophospholipase L1-like esterase
MTYFRLVLVIIATAMLGTTVSAGDAPAPRTAESAITPVDRNPKRHEAFLKRIKEGPVGLLFLGDSIMDAFPGRGKDTWAKFSPYKPADFGISAERTEDVLWRITNGELDGIDPKAVVIMIGTNNVGHFADEKVEWAAAGIKKIVDTVREKLPKTKVLLLGVFPRGTTKEDGLRKKVAEINDIIKGYAQPPAVTYLDLAPKFLDEQGNLTKDIMPDALHPSAKGYEIWYDAMLPVLEPLLK